MVPPVFVVLEELPLSPNGKIDRNALPDPDQSRPELDRIFVPPSTDVEKTMAAIWSETLKIEEVGIHDNFFDLGGHSLLMIQVHGRLRETFDRELSIIDLFRYPTINALSEFISQGEQVQADLERRARRAQNLSEGKNRLQKQLKLRKRGARRKEEGTDEKT